MKQLSLVVFILIIIQVKAYSQSCLPDGINFTTQAQIDNFQSDFPGCTTIEGGVKISGNDISDLEGISVLDSIFGNLTIGSNWKGNNPNLNNLDGLENLAYIGGTLLLNNNDNLVNIQGLSGLVKVEEGIYISNDNLISLTGLEGIDSLYGNLNLQINDQLLNLTGLNNLKYIGGSLAFYSNEGLINLVGLDNLTTVAGRVDIWGNLVLTSLTGLENLSSVGDLSIEYNESLTSLSGLEGMDSIGGDMALIYNELLPNLTGLEGLTSIGGELWIKDNYSLTSLEGLDNISAESISSIWIYNNQNLSDCNIQSICDYLADPNGQINIYRNAIGCDNPHEIADNCGITLSCLPFGNYLFYSQAEIDSFPSYYSDCDQLEGFVGIQGEDITHLDSLSGVDTINGTLFICGNENLSSLNGLNNVRIIQGDLWIGWIECSGNNELTNLEGLNNLISVGNEMLIMYNPGLLTLSGLDALSDIGSGLSVMHNVSLKNLHGMNNLISAGSVYISENYSLLNLNGLQGLINVDGSLSVKDNPALFSINGIANVDADLITYLHISHNNILSNCNVQSVCDYLADPGGFIEIIDNDTGCNSQEEVELACGVGLKENFTSDYCTVYPNPFTGQTTFNIRLQEPADVKLLVCNNFGQVVATILDESLNKGDYRVIWNAERLPPDIYIYHFSTGHNATTGKIIKVR
ncbi:MAG: T9SS type A sorting domain-containing protein [Bacteroidales bacterium]|nr:T9SS type A sorting domain-containing protein [Bacteroidales bacterium]